ncbi:hypothetical protein [Micromonospora coerulea]|uniref:hypothetical protein n=1 Tax=Micromonospora coerulea TaxID=47856 RepID=UPI001F4060BF|nr:hypothetical protein [Micromonospora veneta]
MILVDRNTGGEADPVIVDRTTGRPLDVDDFVFAAGPAASEVMRKRYERIPTRPVPSQHRP